jgi:hypothetical protein
MNAQHDDIDKLSPQKLMGVFSETPALMAFGVAVILHVLVIGGTSLSYIYATWINPSAPVAEEDAANGGSGTDAAGGTNVTAVAATNDAATAGEATADEGAATGPAEGQAEAPVVKRVTEASAPGETPDLPDDIGIKIEDTNL